MSEIKATDAVMGIESEEPEIMQCINCWHRWRVVGYAPMEPCPKCASFWQVYVSLITENLRMDEEDAKQSSDDE